MRVPYRPTTYNGIEMRSRLEAWWAARLDRAGITWTYEPNAFADETGQYLPDFRWDETRGPERVKRVYLECKGRIGSLEALNGFLGRMEVIWSSEPEATLVLVEGHGERYYFGRVDPDGSKHWTEYEGDWPLPGDREAA